MKTLFTKSLYLLFVALFFLTACSAKQTDTPTVFDTPRQSQSLPIVTFTLIPVEQSATPTPIPSTSTPAPTLAFSGDPAAGAAVTGEDGATLVFVPQGDFTMGADANTLFAECEKMRSDCRHEWFTNVEPPRTVTLDPFWIDQTEVTNKMYLMCVNAGKCKQPFQSNSSTRDHYFGNPKYDNFPVIYVSWDQANAYCTWAGRRLPTEAEWEKAARGTDGRYFPWGNDMPSRKLLNYSLNVGDTTSVKNYPDGVSPYGVYDMSGNVWEWVADWYEENYYNSAPSSNPMGPASGRDKVSRGGGWIFYDFDTFSTERYGNDPGTTNNVIGFRCARSR